MRKKKDRLMKVPAATVALYIGTAVVILGICAAVFFIGFNSLNGGNDGVSSMSESSVYFE